MVRRWVALLACVHCLAFGECASTAVASTKNGEFAVEEAGRASCLSFTKAGAAKNQDYHRYVGFVEGYLTAANRYEPNTFDLTPWHTPAAIALILKTHCQKYPKDNLAMAAQRLVIALAPVRLASFSKIVEVGDAKNKTYIYSTILKRAQFELVKKGLFKGEPNGQYDQQTRTALTEFQKLAKIDPTGVPDTPTLWILLNP